MYFVGNQTLDKYLIYCLLFEKNRTFVVIKMKEAAIIKKLKEEFKDRDVFSRNELYQFFTHYTPELKETTFRWRIHDLKQKQIIRSVSRAGFSLYYQPAFFPEIDLKIKNIFQQVKKDFPYIKISIWNTKWLNQMMLHQPGKFLTILEVENEAKSSVFNFLKDTGHKNIFLEPSKKEIENYISGNNDSIIVLGLISKSPTIEVNKIIVPSIEKILVDIFSDTSLYASFQGSEMTYIYENAFKKYDVNATRLYNYANRRNKRKDLEHFILSNTIFPIKELI